MKEAMHSRRSIIIALIFAGLLALPGAAFAAGKNLDSPAAQFVQKLGDKALTSLTARDLSGQERARRVHTLLTENFDIGAISRFVLGRHWREATDAQRAEYAKLFEDMIVTTYTQRFADYSGQSFKVTGALKTDSATDTIVTSVIVQKDGGPPVNVDWRVRDKGSMKIVDVLVDSISMSVTQRSDFDAVIQSGGGKIEALLSTLRQRVNGKGK
jgi:phospholipid transport system substrate-binding protein